MSTSSTATDVPRPYAPGGFGHRHGLSPLGVGIGLRREFFDELPRSERHLDWVEVVPENFMGWGGRPRRALRACAERWPTLPHGVSMNVGGPDPLDPTYLSDLKALAEEMDAPFCSDHLVYSRIAGTYLHDLLPLPFSAATVEHVVPRIREIADRLERPFLIENPSYYALMPGSQLGEAACFRAVLEEADCGLLLDVNNVYVNACNHGYDAWEFICALPLERVVQIHLAGHTRQERAIIDTHIGPVPGPVWDLYRRTLERMGPVSTLIEWDQQIPGLDAVLDEADRARRIYDEVASALTPVPVPAPAQEHVG